MSEHTEEEAHSSGTDGLWRWLLGGLAGGAIILGLLIAAYAIGYHRGQHHPRTAAPASSTSGRDDNDTTPRRQYRQRPDQHQRPSQLRSHPP
jgi:hypothetical protein